MHDKAKQSAFTLTEVVVVLAILGILTTFAVPRFTSLEREARGAAVQALTGSIRSSAALAHALWLAQDQAATVTMEGRLIAIDNGYPSLTTIDDAVADMSGFSYDPATGIFAKVNSAGTPIANCFVKYTPMRTAEKPPAVEPTRAGC